MTSNEMESCETKIQSPEQLHGVNHDNRHLIAVKAKTVAELPPSDNSKRLAIAAVHGFMQSHPPMSGIDTTALIVDGRD